MHHDPRFEPGRHYDLYTKLIRPYATGLADGAFSATTARFSLGTPLTTRYGDGLLVYDPLWPMRLPRASKTALHVFDTLRERGSASFARLARGMPRGGTPQRLTRTLEALIREGLVVASHAPPFAPPWEAG